MYTKTIFALTIIVSAIVAISYLNQATARVDSEDAQFDSLSASYSDYLLQTIESHSDVSEEDANIMIQLFENMLASWSNPLHRRYAWEVLVSLNNTREHWHESLAACDAAIAEATDDGVLFDFQYDRWTVLQRLDGENETSRQQYSVSSARDETVNTFMRLFHDQPNSAAVADRALRFEAIAWGAERDTNNPKRFEIAKTLVELVRMPEVGNQHQPTMIQNHIGYLSGLMIAKDPSSAARQISTIQKEKGKLLASVIALELAESEKADPVDINKFIWEVKNQFQSDTLWLNLAVRHIQTLLKIAQGPTTVDSLAITGAGAEKIAGVPSEDVLNLIEPSVSALIGNNSYTRIPTSSDSEDYHQNFMLMQTSIYTLSEVLELMGDHDSAEAYLAHTSKGKLNYRYTRRSNP